jgi:hypothetical protein
LKRLRVLCMTSSFGVGKFYFIPMLARGILRVRL